MRQETRNIYTFDELSDDAKKFAIEKHLPNELFWADEMLDSVRAFCALFNAKLKEWQLSAYDTNYFISDVDASSFRGYTLKQAETIPEFLTGYCLDCTLTDTFKKEFKRNGLFEAIASSCEPFHHQGFGMHVSALPGVHLGKRVKWSDLPVDVQKFARQSFPEFN